MTRRSCSAGLLGVVQILVLVFTVGVACAYDGRLIWESSPEPVDGYRIYYTPVPLDIKVVDVGTSLECALDRLELSPGSTYYFAASAYSGEMESEISNIVTAVMPDRDVDLPAAPPAVSIPERVRVEADSFPSTVSRPQDRDTHTQIVMLFTDESVFCDKSRSTISISGPNRLAHGVASAGLYPLGNMVILPLSIYRQATQGIWRVSIETDVLEGDVPFVEIIEADIMVQ